MNITALSAGLGLAAGIGIGATGQAATNKIDRRSEREAQNILNMFGVMGGAAAGAFLMTTGHVALGAAAWGGTFGSLLGSLAISG